MPANEEDKQSVQKNLLQELRDLQAVLDAETVDAIPVLSDVVAVSSAAEAAITADEKDIDAANPNNESDIELNSIPKLEDRVAASDSVGSDADSKRSSAANDPAAESQPIAKETAKPAPFALVDSNTDEYDSSAAESLIEEGLNEALAPLTKQMDDEALRLVDDLVAEHAELIRQQLRLKLAAKSKELQAESHIDPPN